MHHFGNDDADHASLDHINSSNRDQDQCILVGRQMPGQEGRGKLSDALESIGKETDDADECIDHYDQVR